MKKLICTVLVFAMMLVTFAGCAGKSNTQAGAEGELSGKLVFSVWDTKQLETIEQTDMIAKFQELYPNVEIEVEKLKDATEYENAMKMRASANQLPDIMYNKPYTLSRFQDYLVDLSDTEAAKNNIMAEGYAVNGKILGIPMTYGTEYVYYWKDMFEEAGVEVPTTWEELKSVSLTLQEHFGAQDKDFMAIAIGAKDNWTTYPYVEFAPGLVNGNGQNWNDMAKVDSPFAEGTDINIAYHRVYDLFSSGVFGKDPLGLGNDQAVGLFSQKKAAMIALGSWGLEDIKNRTESVDELGTFYMPVRETEEEPFYKMVLGDSILSVTTHSQNPELAVAFLEWYASEAYYPSYIDNVASESVMNYYTKEKDPILAEADEAQPDAEIVVYDGGGDDFTAIKNEIAFDYKKLGAEMFVDGFDLDAALSELDAKWAAAREKLGIE